MLKYGCVSVVYAVMVNVLNSKLKEMLGVSAEGGSPMGYLVTVITALCFVIPIICFAVNALKINNLYNVRRFFARAIGNNAISVVIFAGILIYEGFLNPVWIGYMIGAFVISIMWLGREYNLPLKGNER